MQSDAAIVPASTSTVLVDRSGATGDAELVALWLATKGSANTRRAYQGDADAYLAHLQARGRSLRTATVADVVSFVDALSGATSSRARRVSSIKSLHTFASRTGFAPFNVATVVSAPKVANTIAERTLDEHEVRRLLDAARPGRDAALVRFLYASGARISEACALRWQHVHVTPDGTAVVTIHGKGAKTRHVRISAATVSALVALRGGASADGFVFSTSTGHALDAVNASRTIGDLSRRVLGRAVSAHWFRHAHASHALDRGAPAHLVRDTLGHASLATTSRYVHARAGESSGRFLNV